MKRASILLVLILTAAVISQTGVQAIDINAVNPDADGSFTIAVMPDTQQEVVNGNLIQSKAFKNRSEWLVSNKDELDLRYVIHTGDMANWDTPDHNQFLLASEAFSVLDEAEINYSIALGNHDTAAVGPGGSAADPKNTSKLVRDTTTFNTYFPTTRFPGIVCFEKGKVDNSYRTFTAVGIKWLLLTLELWPRTEVIEWARDVVKSNPTYNVLVSTHSYLESTGTLYPRVDYGATSPQYLYDNLIKLYSNIKMVFCGHVGTFNSRIDTGVNGNKILSITGGLHSNTNNPVQLVNFNLKENTVTTRFYAPLDGATWPQYEKTFACLSFIGSDITAPTSVSITPEYPNVLSGDSLTLTVTPTSGSTPYHYLWYKNGNAIKDATDNTYTIPSAAFADSGQYYCYVNGAQSDTVTIKVKSLTTPTKKPSPTPYKQETPTPTAEPDNKSVSGSIYIVLAAVGCVLVLTVLFIKLRREKR